VHHVEERPRQLSEGGRAVYLAKVLDDVRHGRLDQLGAVVLRTRARRGRGVSRGSGTGRIGASALPLFAWSATVSTSHTFAAESIPSIRSEQRARSRSTPKRSAAAKSSRADSSGTAEESV